MSYVFYKEKEFVSTLKCKYPKSWKCDRFDSFITLEYGKGLPEPTRREGLYPVFGSNGVVGYHDEKLVKGPGIVVGRKGTIGAVALSTKDFWPIDTTFYVRMKADEIDWNWLFYELVHLNLPKLSSADVVPGLKRELVNNLIVPLPSLAEQQRVAEVLGVVDSALEMANRVIAKTERLKKGLMQQLLTHGIGHSEYKESPVGKIPKEWQISTLKEVAEDFVGGGTPSTSNHEYWNGDIAWMTSAHINGKLVVTGQKYITKKGLESSATHVIPRNNLLVATRVGIGKVAINEIDIAISQDLTGVKINKEKAMPAFLYWFLINQRNKLRSLAQGSTIKGILKEDLSRLEIPLPSLFEQQKIDEILTIADRKLAIEKTEKALLERIKSGLMDLLLTGKVRIKSEQA